MRTYSIAIRSPCEMVVRLNADYLSQKYLIFVPCSRCGRLFCSNISAANLHVLNSFPVSWSEKCKVCDTTIYGRISDLACKLCNAKLECIFSGCGQAVFTYGGIW